MKACQCCRAPPPAGPYRWVHRICTSCAAALKTEGCIPVESAFQIQAGLHVPTCYPGIVCLRGVEKQPPAKKWEAVSWDQGQVKISWAHARLGKPVLTDKPKNLVDFKKEDFKLVKPARPEKFTHALLGIGVSGCNPCVSANTALNKVKASCGRLFRKETEQEIATNGSQAWGSGPRPGVWDKAWDFVDILLPDLISKMEAVEDWLQSMPSRRKIALNLAFERLKRNGWKKGYAKFSAFVKTELLPGFEKTKWGPEPLQEMLDRLIQGPRDETHVIAGPHLKPLTKQLKKVWNNQGPIFYAATTPEEQHEFLQRLLHNSFLNGTCDFSMFDATHSDDTFKFMAKLYKRAGISDPMFWKVFTVWQRPRGSIGPVVYRAGTMNASGRDDTSLLNAVLNGVCTVLSLASVLSGVEIEQLQEHHVRATLAKIVLGVAGDDSIWTLRGIDRTDVQDLKEAMVKKVREFGFVAKLQISDRVQDMVFLGNRPYPVGGQWYWGKTIGRAAYKMGWTLLAGKGDLMAHITGVHEMHQKCSAHVPVIADIANKICELRKGGKRNAVVRDPDKPWEWTLEGVPPYDHETLCYVAECYNTPSRGVTCADVEDLLEAIRGVRAIPCVVEHWLLEHMVMVDEL